MASRFNTLLHGDLDEVEVVVDNYRLDDGEVRAVLANLIRRVRRLERAREEELERNRGRDQ